MQSSVASIKIVLVVLGVIALILVAVAASRVGGIAIRSTGSRTELLQLTVTNPATRGVLVTVRWNEGVAPADIELIWRTRDGETFVGHGSINTQAARVVFPCTGAENGTLLVREVTTGKTLGMQVLALLAPTADCLRSATVR